MSPAFDLAPSWYEATVKRDDAKLLQGERSVEVCVIGGGLAGLTTALVLAQAGKQVALLEGGRVARGASGRNGGFVSGGFALGIDAIAKHVGTKAAQDLYQLSVEGREFVRQTIAAHEPSIAMGQGLRVCVRYNDGGSLHGYADELQETYGEPVVRHDATATRAVLQTGRYFDSISFPRAFHIHPLRYALLVKRLAEELGATIYENAPALHVERGGGFFNVKTPHGTVNAQHVVYCVSALDRKLHPFTGRAVLPVATYVAVSNEVEQKAIQTHEAIADTRRAGDYYRLIDGNRILWGGRITTARREPMDLAHSMHGDMSATFAQLAQTRMEFAWGGTMGYALHKMPLIGRDEQGQWFATAFGGHGLNTTAMAGLLIGRAIAEKDDRYRHFAPFAPRWAYGQFGRAGVQGSYWWMQLRDRFDEATKTGIRR